MQVSKEVGGSCRIPFGIRTAILLSFFPLGILFWVHYPVREVIVLCVWVWAFPSQIGYLSFLLLLLAFSAAHAYFAFNLFVVLETLAIGVAFGRWVIAAREELIWRLHRFLRTCLILSLVIAAIQAINGAPWLRAFPEMFAVGHGRGSGLRTEPSLLASPLVLYLGFALCKFARQYAKGVKQRGLFLEVIGLISATTLLTRSLTVLLVVLCFLPTFVSKLSHLVLFCIGGAISAAAALGTRVSAAISDSETFTYFITTAFNSWRNIPDIIIFLNWRDFLLPGNPAEVRDKINLLATIWNPGFFWLDNTYSTFSASASTIGLLATMAIFSLGIRLGLRRTTNAASIRVAWIMLYVADWFVLPKYEPCGWVALGLLTAAATVPARAAVEPLLVPTAE